MFRVSGLTSVQGSGFGHDSSSPAASFLSGFRRMRGFFHQQVELWPQGTSIGFAGVGFRVGGHCNGSVGGM